MIDITVTYKLRGKTPLQFQQYLKKDVAIPAKLCANTVNGCTMSKDAHFPVLLFGLYDFTIGMSVFSHRLRSKGFTVIVSDTCPFLR